MVVNCIKPIIYRLSQYYVGLFFNKRVKTMIKSMVIKLFGIKDMARPRVFISSTCYDLKQVRIDIDRFLKEVGYESVRNETGQIAYSRTVSAEEGCYREIENVDIVVSIIGGRFGSLSNDKEMSISQRELKKAISDEKQVFIFIDKAVYAEYNLWHKNKNKEHIKDIEFYAADDVRIFEHIENIKALNNNNAYTTFDSSHEIVGYLKEQFAGLFQRFLQQQKKIKETNLIDQLSGTATSLQKIVDYFSQMNINQNQTINELVLSNHPAINKIREILDVKYRVFFLSLSELDALLNANGYASNMELETIHNNEIDKYYVYMYGDLDIVEALHINAILFDEDNKLKPMTTSDWKEEYIYVTVHEYAEDENRICRN